MVLLCQVFTREVSWQELSVRRCLSIACSVTPSTLRRACRVTEWSETSSQPSVNGPFTYEFTVQKRIVRMAGPDSVQLWPPRCERAFSLSTRAIVIGGGPTKSERSVLWQMLYQVSFLRSENIPSFQFTVCLWLRHRLPRINLSWLFVLIRFTEQSRDASVRRLSEQSRVF